MTYRLNAAPNWWGCYDSQCNDSTWDHACPVIPDPDIEPEVTFQNEVSSDQGSTHSGDAQAR